MIDIQTLPDRRTVTPAEVEAALLDGYAAFVRLAYLILPPSLGRHRRVLAAHGVVQHTLPDRRRLERQLAGESDASGFLRRRVVQDAIKQADSRTPLRLLPQTWGRRLFPQPDAADDLALRRLTPDARAAWALVRAERLSVDDAEQQLRAMGIQHSQAAINEAALRDEGAGARGSGGGGGGFGGSRADSVFDPCAMRLAPTDLMRRKASGRAVAITVTAVLSVAILISLIATAR